MGVGNSSARFRRMGISAKSRVAGRIVEAYDYFWDAFCDLVSKSRRDNGFCLRPHMRNGQKFGIGTKSHYQSNLHRMTGRGAVNLGNFAGSGLIEFRMHNGTLNSTKITNWALLHHQLISWACNTDPVDFRNHSPDLTGLLEMLNVGSDLKTALILRASETLPTDGVSMNIHNSYLRFQGGV